MQNKYHGGNEESGATLFGKQADRTAGQSWPKRPVHVGGGVSIIRAGETVARSTPGARAAALILVSKSGDTGEIEQSGATL